MWKNRDVSLCCFGSSSHLLAYAATERLAMSVRNPFAVNVKTRGKTHKVKTETIHLPPENQKLKCGWKASKSTSQVFTCVRISWGSLCLKCFPKLAAPREEQEHDEVIEDWGAVDNTE